MLNRLTALLLLILSGLAPLRAQSEQDLLELRQDLETYRRASMNLSYDTMLSFMPPQMLAMIPKESLKEQIEQAFENEALYMVFDSMEYGQIPPLRRAGDYRCAIIPYTGHMQMHFKEERDSSFLSLMISMLEAQFSEGAIRQVETDSSRYLSIDLRDKSFIAFKKDGFDSWKFIEDKRGSDTPENDRQLQFQNMIVPAEVLDATQPEKKE